MPRQKKWPPSVHRHRSGQAFVRWQGRDHYLGRHGSPQAEAAYVRLLAELQAGRVPAPKSAPPLTVTDVVAEWWKREAPRYTARGREVPQYRLSLAPLLALHGPTPAAQFGLKELKAVQLAMAAGSWKPGAVPLSRGVVNQRVGRIKTLWRWAEDDGLVPEGSWGRLRSLRGLAQNDARVRHLPRRRAATVEDFRKVVRAATGSVRVALWLLWWSGMRPGELRLLRAEDIDRTGPVWLYRPQQHKNDWRGQPRVVPLGPKCQAVLRAWWRDHGESGYVVRPFSHRPGQPYHRRRLAQLVHDAADRAGMRLTSYQLRHSFKDRVTRKFNLDAARSALGQHSIGTTNQYGEQVDIGQASAVAEKMG